jgi:HSP20 family molecular chaperone IbpA
MSQVEIERVSETDDRQLPIFAEFDKLAEQIRLEAYELFGNRGAGHGHALEDWLEAEHKFCWPAAELTEADDKYLLKVAVAGFEPKEITVTATPREIMVKATHKHEASGDEGEKKIRWSEFRSNDVLRRVELATNVVVDEISAEFKNGLLEITAPKVKSKAATAKGVELTTPS